MFFSRALGTHQSKKRDKAQGPRITTIQGSQPELEPNNATAELGESLDRGMGSDMDWKPNILHRVVDTPEVISGNTRYRVTIVY